MKKNQRGATLITVLVGVSFMVMLASIILSVSFANLRMKQMEYAAKQNFYQDELGLSDIYNGIGRKASECLSKAYSEVLTRVTNEKGEGVYQNQQAAYQEFEQKFYAHLHDAYRTDLKKTLQSYVTQNEDNSMERTDQSIVEVVDCDGAFHDAGKNKFVFKNLVLSYTERDGSGNDTGYESLITTDIVVEAPYISFFRDFSRVLDYAMVGNKGIFFDNSSARVEGNVYAGTDSREKNADYMGYRYQEGNVYDGMNFWKSDITFLDNSYLVSKGDFNVCESAVRVGIDSAHTQPQNEDALVVNLWAENIRTVEEKRAGSLVSSKGMPSASEVYMHANMHVANDLELNARGSNVSLFGNYYGYNSNSNAVKSAYETQENKNTKDKYNVAQMTHATSSSIIMNANDCVLDLEGLNTLLVAGLAYVDIRNPAHSYNEQISWAGERRTAESLALRYNQFLYLAPSDILTVSNPLKEANVMPAEACPPLSDPNSRLSDWFGYPYLNEAVPVIPVVYHMVGADYTYYFLNFSSDAKAREYLTEIFAMEKDPGESGDSFEKQKWELKQEILAKASRAGMKAEVKINGNDCKIYTQGVVSSTAGKVYQNTEPLPLVYNQSLNMANHFMYLYHFLDPKEQFSLTSDTLTLDDINKEITQSGLDPNMLPADCFVDLNKIIGVDPPRSKVNGYDVVICSGNPVITEDVNGIVIAKGDVTLENVKINGLVIAGGKIIVKGNCTITSDKGVVQSILESEQRTLSKIDVTTEDPAYLRQFASYYFKHEDTTLLEEITPDPYADRVNSTAYSDFMYYENWQKGQRQ